MRIDMEMVTEMATKMVTEMDMKMVTEMATL
jgi:hypothetical protein